MGTCAHCQRPTTSSFTRFNDWYYSYNRERTCPSKSLFANDDERRLAEKSCLSEGLVNTPQSCWLCDKPVHELLETRQMEYLHKGKVVLLRVGNVPVWTCGDCGDCYTDWRAEDLRQAAVDAYLAGLVHVHEKS